MLRLRIDAGVGMCSFLMVHITGEGDEASTHSLARTHCAHIGVCGRIGRRHGPQLEVSLGEPGIEWFDALLVRASAVLEYLGNGRKGGQH